MNETAKIDSKTNVPADGLRVPIPLYRHAAPSAPWPWMDLQRDSVEVGSSTSTLVTASDGNEEGHADDGEGRNDRATGMDVEGQWEGYPQSLFGNWTADQVRRCRMFDVMLAGSGTEGGMNRGSKEGGGGCVVYQVDVFCGGVFKLSANEEKGADSSEFGNRVERVGDRKEQQALWTRLGQSHGKSVRLRAFFIECMSGPVLQILGTRYEVEPFFFASSANWIPSKYQEDAQPGEGDHITVVLPFVRVVRNAVVADEAEVIDTQTPLRLSGGVVLLQDLLAVHMVRTTTSDTILSYHPDSALRRGSAIRLQSLLRRTGESVYWSKLYKRCKDPTIVLLALLWHAIYAWDEALEESYDHLNKTLEARELSNEDASHTRELHRVRAHLICYQQLLRDFRGAVAFIKKTTNPAMQAASMTTHERKAAANIIRSEADHLLDEIERLDKQREMQTDRIKNVMSLAISTAKNDDTKAMHGLTTATVRDAATMKQLSYFTLVFLPSYFLAGVFRMNVKEVNPKGTETMTHYIEGTVIFTLCSAWLVIALQDRSRFHPGGRHIVQRIAWPVFCVWGWIQANLTRRNGKSLARKDSVGRKVNVASWVPA